MIPRLAILALVLASVARAKSPNVVFLVSDDQAWGDYGFMGHEHIETPRLDRLAKQSLVFTRGTTHTPLCRPSLATMLTGLYPHQHGITGNDAVIGDPKLNSTAARRDPKHGAVYRKLVDRYASHPSLVRDLAGAGYRCLQTGKWWEGDPVKDGGFTEAMTRGTGDGARHGDDGLAIGREGLEPITRFLDEGEGKPFFIWYAPFLPHAPHTPPRRLLEKYQPLAPSDAVARYWACVEWFDETCGALIDELESRGLMDDTLIVYTCDNGWIQDPGKPNRYAPRSKQSPYEGGVRTPIFFHWRGRIEPMLDRETLAGNIDLWPTVAALLERETPEGLPGLDLTDKAARSARTRIFGEVFPHDIGEVDHPSRSPRFRYIIDGWDKLIVSHEGTGTELYDLRSDPNETQNLTPSREGRTQALRTALDAWWKP